MRKKNTAAYTKIIYLLVSLLLLIAIFRLSQIALSTEVDNFNLSAYSESRNTVSEILLASRGNILDNSGNLLAQTINSYTLIAYLEESRTTDEDNPQHVVDIETTANLLAPVLGIEESDLINTLSKDKYQVELATDITELTKSQIDDLNLVGIEYVETTDRYYPSGTFASYLVGYAKKDDEGKIVGELGIEGYYNSLLTGVDGQTTYQKDAYGYTIPNTPSYTEESVSGYDVYLTIDSTIQLILENAINKIEATQGYEWSVIAVMDATTGAILGSATTPSFDPNDLNTIESNYLNPLVSFTYEPGSTMKTFSFAAAIEEGIYDGDSLYTSGSIEIVDYTISDFNDVGWGEISYDTGYAYSSNVAASLLGLELGVGTLLEYYTNLGFGSLTGIELSNEYSGSVNFLYNVELANASFGQGISVTPIQMLQAYTVISNDGVMLQPYIVDKIVDENGEIYYQSEVTEVMQVYSSDTIDKMKELMYDAVYNSTSSNYIPDNVTIIGKSGTAQIAGNSGYLTGSTDYVRSFVSIFPVDEPEYIFYIATSKYQESVSSYADIITTAIDEIASYANVTDNEQEDIVNQSITLDNYISKNVEDVVETLESSNLEVVLIGDGNYVIDQYPYKNATLFEDDKVFIITNSNNYSIIDLTGYSSSDLERYCTYTGISCETSGYGYVVSQNMNEEDVLEIVLG